MLQSMKLFLGLSLLVRAIYASPACMAAPPANIFEPVSSPKSWNVKASQIGTNRLDVTISSAQKGLCEGSLIISAYGEPPESDPDIEEDEEEGAYPVRNYDAQIGDCQLSFRVKFFSEPDRMTLVQSGCEKLFEQSGLCPIQGDRLPLKLK